MDIVAVQSMLTDDGFPMRTQEIKDFVSRFLAAVASGKVRSSSSGNEYPIRQVLYYLFDRDLGTTYLNYWKKAVKLCPRLSEFQLNVSASSSKPVFALPIIGVVCLAAVLKTFADCDGQERESKSKSLALTEPQTITEIEGYIYVLCDSTRKVLKVGFTTDIDLRMRSHLGSNPFLVPLMLYSVQHRKQEALLHSRLRAYRIPKTREWYVDDQDVRQAIFNFFNKLD